MYPLPPPPPPQARGLPIPIPRDLQMGAGEDGGPGGTVVAQLCLGSRRGLSLGCSTSACSVASPPLEPPNALLFSVLTCLLMEWEAALSRGRRLTTSSQRLIAAVEIYCVLAVTQSQPLLGVYFSPLMHCTQQPRSI